MVSRRVLAIFAIALIAVSVNAAPAKEIDIDADFERSGLGDWFAEASKKAGKKIVKEVMEFVKEKASRVNLDCVKEVYEECKTVNPLKHPKKYYKCAKNYVVEHNDHCYLKAESTEE